MSEYSTWALPENQISNKHALNLVLVVYINRKLKQIQNENVTE